MQEVDKSSFSNFTGEQTLKNWGVDTATIFLWENLGNFETV